MKKEKNTEKRSVGKLRILKKIIPISLCAILLVAVVSISYAYFTKLDVYKAYFGASIDAMFDRLDRNAVSKDTDLGNGAKFDPDAAWGSKSNPYVISQTRHLNNLSALQNIGYFYNRYTKAYNPSEMPSDTMLPHFLVCETDGTPVCIKGGNKAIEPIGTEEFPFIGTLHGAFVPGDCTVGGKKSADSAIYDVTVSCAPDSPDVGLFGYISYLGDECSAATEGEHKDQFYGVVSEISDLLLYDIQVKVDENSNWVETLIDYIILGTDDHKNHPHKFSFGTYGKDASGNLAPNPSNTAVPHENRHVGIGFGHIEYLKLKNISVYYSAETVAAIKLSDAETVNYMSTTGIVGFLYNMNPVVNGNLITKGSGVDSEDILAGTITGGSTIPGGGLLSGTEKGYVWAKGVYDKYKWIGKPAVEDTTATEDTSGTINIMEAHDKDGNPLCREEQRIDIMGSDGYSGTGKYYFYDGVFTFALSKNDDGKAKDKITNTWENGVDNFYVGTSDANWNKIDFEGDSNIAAFMQPLTSEKELSEAIASGKKLVISYTTDAGVFLMTLNEESDPDNREGITPDVAFFTLGQSKSYLDTDSITNLKNTFPLWTPNGVGGNSVPSDFGTKLQGNQYSIVNLTSADFISQLESTYTVSLQQSTNANDFEYYFYNTDSLAEMTYNSTLNRYEVKDREQYKPENDTDEYGYFYFTFTPAQGWNNAQYNLCYKSLRNSGNSKTNIYTIDVAKVYGTSFYVEDELTALEAMIEQSRTKAMNVSGNWGDVTLYTCTVSGSTTLSGPVININDGQAYIYNDNQEVEPLTIEITEEGLFTSGESIVCYIRNATTGKIDTNHDGTYDEVYIGSFTSSGDTEPKTYTLNSNPSVSGYIVDKLPLYKIGSADGSKYMRLLPVSYVQTSDSTELPAYTYQLLWNGGANPTSDDLNQLTNYMGPTYGPIAPKIEGAGIQYASIRYSNGRWRIVYSDDATSTRRYVSYNTEGTGRFTGVGNLTGSNNTNSLLQIYVLDATKSESNALHGYLPDKMYNNSALSAKDYVIFAQSSQYVDGTTDKRPINDPKDTFILTEVSSLNWNLLKSADQISSTLSKKFQMSDRIREGQSMDFWGVTSSTENLVRAPVGSNGVEANIPQSCIAFRMNSSGAKKIQVIVAIPTSEIKYDDGTVAQLPVCYFNLWHFPPAGWEEGVVQTFTPESTLDRFNLPISADTENNFVDITVQGETDTYKTHLGGKQVLVAYEFTVNAEGIYILGATGFDTANGNKELNVPTQIVYFAADSVSSGDGQLPDTETNESRMGTIDFVYDNESEILLVAEKSPVAGDGTKNFAQYYYPTYCILYFDNNVKDVESFVNINSATVNIRRTQAGSSATLINELVDPNEIKINNYSPNSDTLAAPPPPPESTG